MHETIDALYKMMQNKRGGANIVAARFIGCSRLTRARRSIRLTGLMRARRSIRLTHTEIGDRNL